MQAGDPNADIVVMGITFVSVIALLLITLMATSCYIFHENIDFKKDISVVSS